MGKDFNGRMQESNRENAWIWIACGICILAIIYVVFRVLGSNSAEQNITELSKSNSNSNNTNIIENSSTAESSSTIGKNVNQVKNEIESNSLKNDIKHDEEKNTTKNTTTNKTENGIAVKENNYKVDKNNTSSNTNVKSNTNEEPISENAKDIKFSKPVDGEIIREFAKDNLIYSQTLKEWITHNGIDIKADKASVVKAAAKGKVESIKNDPRYGLTVIINHDNGFQTIYSNLLTAEFVVEGEELEEGQTIGTVGNTATFEVADDYHVHFEILKNNENVDPTSYMK